MIPGPVIGTRFSVLVSQNQESGYPSTNPGFGQKTKN
jgi:hypothetical protein